MRRKLCCKKLGTSRDVKSFAKGVFLERFVVKIANDYPLISIEICPENSREIGHLLPIVFQ